MDDTITLYSNQDMTRLDRNFEIGGVADAPSDELTGRYEYVISREEFRNAYKHWNHDEMPLLKIHDQLSHTDIYLGKPSAQRVQEALDKKEASAQLF